MLNIINRVKHSEYILKPQCINESLNIINLSYNKAEKNKVDSRLYNYNNKWTLCLYDVLQDCINLH